LLRFLDENLKNQSVKEAKISFAYSQGWRLQVDFWSPDFFLNGNVMRSDEFFQMNEWKFWIEMQLFLLFTFAQRSRFDKASQWVFYKMHIHKWASFFLRSEVLQVASCLKIRFKSMRDLLNMGYLNDSCIGLPDFSWLNIPKTGENIPNYHNITQWP
jgi:hypothetical protein